MAAKNSRPESEEAKQTVKVIVMGGVATESFGEDCTFEIHRCEDVERACAVLGEARSRACC